MNFLDVVLLAVAGFFVYRGYRRGLVREVASLGAVTVGAFLASRYHHLLVPHLKVYLTNPTGITAASYLLTFLATLLLVALAARLLKGFVNLSMLDPIDKAAGGGLGLVEGGIICLVLVLMLKAFLPHAEFLQTSRIAVKLEPVLPYLADVAPTTVRETLQQSGVSLPALPPSAEPEAEKKGQHKGEAKEERKKAAAMKSP